jgi:hypothetical protein
VESTVDLNRLYFDHQIHLMEAEHARSPELRQRHHNGATLIAGRIGCMQRAMGADAANGWSRTAARDPDPTGRPPALPAGPMRVPHDWRRAANRPAA